MRVLTIPNILTCSRFLLVPLFIYLFMQEHYLAAVSTLILAGITDFLDGFIARRFHQRTRLGSLLDPIADKFMMIISFVFLSHIGVLPWSLTWLVIWRDIGIAIGVVALNLLRIKLYYRPTYVSKFATASQITVLVLCFLEVMISKYPLFVEPFVHGVSMTKAVLIFIAILLTWISAGQYAYLGYKFYRYGERKSQNSF